jgi:hypothetical protein
LSDIFWSSTTACGEGDNPCKDGLVDLEGSGYQLMSLVPYLKLDYLEEIS